MEKKNTILLTVIAIATLLVAVVGATFAYFTASITTTGDEDGTKSNTNITTRTMTNAVMDLGNIMASSEDNEAKNVLPGFKMMKSVTVTGTAPEGVTNPLAIDADIVLTATADEGFGKENIKYTIYVVEGENAPKVVDTENPANNLCTASTPKSDPIAETPGTYKFYDAMTCNVSGLGTSISDGTFSTNDEARTTVSISAGKTYTYYILVEYANADADQTTAEAGKGFSVRLDFKPSV